MNEGELLQRVAGGDEDSLIELHRRYVNLVFSMALYVLHDHSAAEEVTQDVFLTIWRKAARYDAGQGTITTWLLTITRRKAIDHHRRNAHHTALPAAAGEHVAAQSATFDPAAFDLHQALTALPIEQQRAIDLIYFRGLTQQETAAHLDVPLGTVKSRVRLAMERLRQLLLIMLVI